MKKISLKKQERTNKNRSLLNFLNIQTDCYLTKKDLINLKGGDGDPDLIDQDATLG